MLKGLHRHIQILLIDKIFHLWLVILLQHVASEVGDLHPVVLSLVVTRRNDNSKVLVGLRLVENGHQHTHSEGDLRPESST